MINAIENFINQLLDYWKHKKYWKVVLSVLSVIAGICATGFLGYFIISFIINHFEFLVLAIIGYFILTTYIHEHYAEKRSAREQALKEKQEMQMDIDKKALEENYIVIRKVLFSALKNTAELLGLKQPLNELDLDSPNHILSQGRFYLYQYVIFRKANLLENDVVKSVLQDEINRLLSNGHVSGLGNQTFYMYEGRMRNYIDLYEITESNAYITISVAIASEEYYQFKTAQYSNVLLIQGHSASNLRDKDF